MIYCFNLDNTLCNTLDKDYLNSTPIQEMIDRVNYLHDNNHEIVIFTARGMGKFKGNVDEVYKEYYELTQSQIKKWGIKYHKLILGKPSFDFFIDDKNQRIQDFRTSVNPKVGFIAGSFDVIHPGYIDMFEVAKSNCEYLVVGLHENPKIERDSKLEPVLSVSERERILKSLKYVDEVVIYKTEGDLLKILKTRKFNVRFLGDDYINKKITGSELQIPLIYIDRSHGWSSTRFKKIIKLKNG